MPYWKQTSAGFPVCKPMPLSYLTKSPMIFIFFLDLLFFFVLLWLLCKVHSVKVHDPHVSFKSFILEK